MIKKSAFLILINTLVFSCAGAHAKNSPPVCDDSLRRNIEIEKAIFMASGSKVRILRIGILDCVLYALKNNSAILIQRIEPKIKEDEVKIAKADFAPTFSADYTLHDNAELSSSALSGANITKSRDIDLNAGVSGKIVTGTEYRIDFINERFKSNSSFQSLNPSYALEPKITITQPLFKGRGILVNKADISLAQNNKLQSEKSFKDTVMDTISKVKTTYYNYALFLENHKIAKLSLARAQDLLEINNARYQKGLISSVDLLETEAVAIQRQEAVLSAESQVKGKEDELKIITNLIDNPELWNAEIQLIDTPQFEEEKIDLLESLKNAFIYRPDYRQAEIDLKNRDIKIMTAKNALLPAVDLVASLGLNGLGKKYQDALNKIGPNFKDWSIGIKFILPLGELDRAEHNKRELEKFSGLLNFKKLEQGIILEVRDKVRFFETEKLKVAVTRLSKEKETLNYEAQKERYAGGELSTHDILDYQDRLSQAELAYIKALVDYNISLIELDKSQGLTLDKNGIKLEE